jgi:hypothetical protein
MQQEAIFVRHLLEPDRETGNLTIADRQIGRLRPGEHADFG